MRKFFAEAKEAGLLVLMAAVVCVLLAVKVPLLLAWDRCISAWWRCRRWRARRLELQH